jgi:hypothetical protein
MKPSHKVLHIKAISIKEYPSLWGSLPIFCVAEMTTEARYATISAQS